MEEPSKWTDPTEEKTKNAPDHDPPEPSPQESQPGTVAAETPELEDQRAAHKLLYQCSIVLFFVHLFAILFYIPLYAVNANPASLLGGAHGGGRGRALAVGLLLSLIPPVLPIAFPISCALCIFFAWNYSTRYHYRPARIVIGLHIALIPLWALVYLFCRIAIPVIE